MSNANRDYLRQLASITNEMLYLADALAPAESIALWFQSISVVFTGESAKDDIASAARAIRRHFNVTTIDKDATSEHFIMTIMVPNSPFYFELQTARENVCRRVDTGRTETRMVADYSRVPKVAKVVPIIDWECDPVLDS